MKMPHPIAPKNPALVDLRRLRAASLAEGATLLTLVLIAVPLKRLAGLPEAVSVMGPIHGAAFLIYFGMVMHITGKGRWSSSEVSRLLLAALIPLGFLMVAGLFKRKQAEQASIN